MNMQTYIRKYAAGALLALGVISMPSCTKHFDTLNTNPDATSTPVPSLLFTKALYDGMGQGQGTYGSSTCDFLLGTMQYTTSYNDVAGWGSKYIASQIPQSYTAFNAAYPDEINELGIVIKALTGNAADVNLLAVARIWRVYCFSRLTDLYGDIPYSQAGLGYDSSLYQPTYDTQQSIYTNMFSELEGAIQSMDASKATYGSADLIYGGSTIQWTKFAYSLMLRLGMRLTKVDIATAQAWVTKAIAGGVITADADIAKMPYLASGQKINQNPLALDLWSND